MAFIPAAIAAIGSGIGSAATAVGGAASSLLGGLGGVSGTLSAVGTGLSIASTLAAGNYQNKIAEQNAKIANENADRAIHQSQIEAQRQDALTLGMIGEQEAIQSASGLSLTGRSQILTRKNARELGRLDALNVAQAGERDAYNFRLDAQNQLNAGTLAKSSAAGNALGSFLGFAANTPTLVGGSRSVQKSYDPWVTKKGLSLRSAGI